MSNEFEKKQRLDTHSLNCIVKDDSITKENAKVFYEFIESQDSPAITTALLEELNGLKNFQEALKLVKQMLGFEYYNPGIASNCQTVVTNLVLMCPSKLEYGLDNDTPTAKLTRPFIEAANGIVV